MGRGRVSRRRRPRKVADIARPQLDPTFFARPKIPQPPEPNDRARPSRPAATSAGRSPSAHGRCVPRKAGAPTQTRTGITRLGNGRSIHLSYGDRQKPSWRTYERSATRKNPARLAYGRKPPGPLRLRRVASWFGSTRGGTDDGFGSTEGRSARHREEGSYPLRVPSACSPPWSATPPR